MEQRVLGDYTLIKMIGQGALGVVYLAEHRFMKRQYALKVLPEELVADRGFIQRFEEEISLLSSLDHPNLVKIHNISFAQGHYFLVTDCIVDDLGESTNLTQYLTALDRRLEEDEVLHILRQVAEPLCYAHQKKLGSKGFAHRNLKLNNLLIGKRRAAHTVPEIYLSDFGLSRIIGAGAVLTRTYRNVAEALGLSNQVIRGQDRYVTSADPQKLTALHTSFLQNFAFLSPEQKRLDSPYASDTKSDVYAFGVLAYFLLMGEFPEGLFDMPSSKGGYRYHWDALVQACLQQQPTRRPDNLLELLDALKPVVNQPIKVPEEVVNLATKSYQEQQQSVSQMVAKYAVLETVMEPQVAAAKGPVALEDIVTEIKSPAAVLKPVFHVPQLERPQVDLDPAAALQVDPTVKLYNPEPKDVANIKPLLTDMVVIRGGSFYRGSQDGNRDEMPRHQVILPSFAIDIHPVTNEQFVRFLEVMGGEKDNHHNDIIRLRDSRIKRSAGRLTIESGYAKHPVVGVTWYGAIAYAKWVGKRLPTEAEWEIAARGGKEVTLYPTGDDIEKTQANFFSSDTTAVMSYSPNGYGLHDMAGNVYEWCYDWYGYNYYEMSMQEPENPQGPLQGVYRVLRGGCWKSLKEDLRCSRRHRNNPGTVNSTYGFRCATDVQLS